METKHTPTPWTVGYASLSVEGKTEKGVMKILDIRGWGHLTGRGHGALGLSDEQGKQVQEANAEFIVRACNSHDALVEALEKIANMGNESTVDGHGEAKRIARDAIAKAKAGVQ